VRCYYIYDNTPGNEPVYQGFSWLKASSNTGGLIAVHGLTNVDHYARREGLNWLTELKKVLIVR
jgi:hypothetical protein